MSAALAWRGVVHRLTAAAAALGVLSTARGIAGARKRRAFLTGPCLCALAGGVALVPLRALSGRRGAAIALFAVLRRASCAARSGAVGGRILAQGFPPLGGIGASLLEGGFGTGALRAALVKLAA